MHKEIAHRPMRRTHTHTHHYKFYDQTNRFLIVMCASDAAEKARGERERNLDASKYSKSNDLLVVCSLKQMRVVTTTGTMCENDNDTR